MLRAYSSILKDKAQQNLDEALFDGLQIIDDFMLILTGIDGTFKQAKNLTADGVKLPGVFMTN